MIALKKPVPVLLQVMVCFVSQECQSCSLLKKDLQVLVNELKSRTEIINDLKDDGATKQDRLLNSVCVCVK